MRALGSSITAARRTVMANKYFQITLWEHTVTDDGMARHIEPTLKNATVSFRGYDDDGNFYCKGIAVDVAAVDEFVFDYLQDGWGVTLVKIYDLKTGKYIDSIG
jgi:hypothetical protein